jgi:aldehyde dehydrogenase (NAD+)
MTDVQMHDPVMQEEIFGPILPIFPIKDLAQAKKFILGFEKPLALYLFSNDAREQNDIIDSVSFGGGCINDTLMHLANSNLPFGGVGASGLGAYHGQHSFDAFSHKKAVLVNGTLFDLPVRYFPWMQYKEKILRLLMK